MKLFIALSLTFSACSAASIRGYIKDKEFPKLRANDRLVDNFQPKPQNLCTFGKTFKMGDEWKASFALETLEPTSGKHVFKSHACGDEDTIIVTMNVEDNMPSHAARLNQGRKNMDVFIRPLRTSMLIRKRTTSVVSAAMQKGAMDAKKN